MMSNHKITTLILFFGILLPVFGSSLLEKQTENHFRKFLNERNRFDGIEHFGGPFLRQYYKKATKDNITTYGYTQPLGLYGDPNQLDIKTYMLTTPVEIKSFDITTLQKVDTNAVFFEGDQGLKDAITDIFTIVYNECSQQWYKNEVVYISDNVNEHFVKKNLEKEPYFCGIESLDADTWQLYFRRGHHLSDGLYYNDFEDEGEVLQFLHLTRLPADVINEKSGGELVVKNEKKDDRIGFFLYGKYEESYLPELLKALRENRIPVGAIKFNGQQPKAVYNQEQNAEPFGHPYFNAPDYSVVLKKQGQSFQVLSISTVVYETPGDIRQTYNNIGLLLPKPPTEVVKKTVSELIWLTGCEPETKEYLEKKGLYEICELYLRIPTTDIQYPLLLIETEGPLSLNLSYQNYGDFGVPNLDLILVNDIWRIKPIWILEDFYE